MQFLLYFCCCIWAFLTIGLPLNHPLLHGSFLEINQPWLWRVPYGLRNHRTGSVVCCCWWLAPRQLWSLEWFGQQSLPLVHPSFMDAQASQRAHFSERKTHDLEVKAVRRQKTLPRTAGHKPNDRTSEEFNFGVANLPRDLGRVM